MLIWLMIGFALVAYVFNMANRNMANRRNPQPKKKTYKEALKDWGEFEKKHPPGSKKGA